jgi:hypothetical protein|tara:strand:- start:9441 stop:9857 length:417 start_codon:yes stop_codon:yes gene_type:complete
MRDMNLIKRAITVLLGVALMVGINSCASLYQDDLSNVCRDQSYRGKLVLQGICMNYVIEMISNGADTSLYELVWTNELTNTEYANVFGLGSICDFPDSLREGDEFNFVVVDDMSDTCAVCEAYSPTPSRKLNIAVCEL